MDILKIEVNLMGDKPSEPEKAIGMIDLSNITKADYLDKYIIYITSDTDYKKYFCTKEARDNYFDYIANKLQVIDLSPIKTTVKKEYNNEFCKNNL